MLNKLLSFNRQYGLIRPGDRVIAAVSGGADSVALLFSLYLLRKKLGIELEAAHFNHHLRGAESDRDEAFVRDLCDRYGIRLHVGSAQVKPGKKGLEAAAREARYAFFSSLSGKIATAHTANDNAETVIMHMVRGTGLKGLGAIAPVRGNLIRPMLMHTRQDVLAFLEEYCLQYVTDSSNDSDQFLRNRIRHGVMPLLEGENPSLAQNLSAMALRLREDDRALDALAKMESPLSVTALRQMPSALRARALAAFLRSSGVKEPEAAHIALAEQLVFSDNPSAAANLPGGVTIRRQYDLLVREEKAAPLEGILLSCPGTAEIPELGVRIVCEFAQGPVLNRDAFTVNPSGQMVIRSRQPGDQMRLQGGTKDLKKLFIDRKIPAAARASIPVIADDTGVLGVYGIGANLDRTGDAVCIRFEKEYPALS